MLQVGDEGAGHFVKMVHNGIEYGDMQLICEAYHLMKDVLGMDHDEMAQVSGWVTPCRWFVCVYAPYRDLDDLFRPSSSGFRRLEQDGVGLLPDRDHGQHPQVQGL